MSPNHHRPCRHGIDHGPSTRIGFVFAAIALLIGCGGGGGGGGGSTPPPDDLATTKRAVVTTYAQIMFAGYADSAATADALHDSIHALIDAPSQEALGAARDAWIAARPFYQRTEIARFVDGPIDRESDGPEGEINAWPLDEAYIDYVDGAAGAGIVNDPGGFPSIDEDTLRSANAQGGEENVSTGWHAIEFLLWGQDFDDAGPGIRPFTDYVADGTGTAANQDRRALYLETAADVLLDDLARVRDQWAPDASYRVEIEALEPDAALSRIMTGVGSLAFGELRGERIVVPFTTKLQEDEHSCFSDTTAQDLLNDARGIQNVWLGRWDAAGASADIDGPGLRDLAVLVAPDLASELDTTIDGIVAALSSSTIEPFDQAIQGTDDAPGRQTLQRVIDLLAQFNEQFSNLARELSIDVDTGSSA